MLLLSLRDLVVWHLIPFSDTALRSAQHSSPPAAVKPLRCETCSQDSTINKRQSFISQQIPRLLGSGPGVIEPLLLSVAVNPVQTPVALCHCMTGRAQGIPRLHQDHGTQLQTYHVHIHLHWEFLLCLNFTLLYFNLTHLYVKDIFFYNVANENNTECLFPKQTSCGCC